MIQIFTAAHGKKYYAMARDMARSFEKFKWPALTVLTDAWIDDLPCNQIVGQSLLYGGRELKTKFGLFADQSENPVFFIDCDCLATGKPKLPKIPNGHLAGRFLTSIPSPIGPLPALAGTMVGAGDSATAARLSVAWYRQHLTKHEKCSDELSLFEASMNTPKIDIGGTFQNPFKNLLHLGATSAERNEKQTKGKWIFSKP